MNPCSPGFSGDGMADENIFLLHAFLLGVFLTFVYDQLRILRKVVPHNGFLVGLEDLGFWAFCSVEAFLLMYRESSGKLRWFAVGGALAGMFLYLKTASPILVKYVSLFLGKVLGMIGKVARFLGKPFFLAGRKAGRMCAQIRQSAARKRKSFARNVKKGLTRRVKVLRIFLTKH